MNEKELTLTAKGTEEAVERGLKYAKCVMEQRSGPDRTHPKVGVDDEDYKRKDLTVLDIPQECVGLVGVLMIASIMAL